VGTTEAHGPACLGTDNYIPTDIAEGIAERINALVAPTVCYGVTKSLYRYRGSSTITAETFGLYLRDVLESFADSEFKNMVIMNGHGGNNAALKTLAQEFHHDSGCNVSVVHWWALAAEITEEFFGHAGGHGGTDETAMVQAVDPNLVSKEEYDAEEAYYFRPGADVYPVPGSILLYKEGEGYPNFDVEQARQYREKVIMIVGDFVESVIAKWRKYGL
jgi:creatinine amidohydrolase